MSMYDHAIEYIEKTFATAADSPAADLRGWTLCGISFGSGYLGTTVKFKVCDTDAGTYLVMIDGLGSDYSKTVAASRYVPLSPTDFAGIAFLKLTSSNASEVGAVKLHCRKIL